MQCKQKDEQEAQPEIRDRHPDLRHPHGKNIAGLATLGSRINTHGNGNRNGQHHGKQGQRQRDHDARTEQLTDRHGIGVTCTEVTFQKAANP